MSLVLKKLSGFNNNLMIVILYDLYNYMIYIIINPLHKQF